MLARRHHKLLAFVFGLLAILFLVLAVFAFTLLKDHQANLRQNTYDQTGIAAVQMRLHYEAMMGSLALVEGPRGADALDGAVLQFDILYERLISLPARPTYDILLDEESLAIRDQLLAALTKVIDRIDLAAEGDAEALRGMYAELAPLRPHVERLAHHPVQIASERRAVMMASLNEIADWFSWVIAGFVVSGLAFAIIIWRQLTSAAQRQTELEDLTESLEVARDAAEAGSRAKSDFLSHMSHELRTPMNAILGFAQLLQMGKLDSKQTQAVGQILRSGGLLMHLIDQILELNKITAGGVVLGHDTVVPADLIDECFALMTAVAEEKGVTLIAQPDGAPVEALETDANRLSQVLINLLSNAIKYNRDDGTVTVVWNRVPGDRVCFRVSDTGEGIPPEREDEIFQPFNRLGRESLNIEGTGIGLTITHELVKMLGGEIQFESRPGEGSSFWFELPLKRAEPLVN
ncbi:sensor histidine kinase [Pseudomonadota bacterium]